MRKAYPWIKVTALHILDFELKHFNPFTPKSDLIDFTLSNARRFYSSKGDPLGAKELI